MFTGFKLYWVVFFCEVSFWNSASYFILVKLTTTMKRPKEFVIDHRWFFLNWHLDFTNSLPIHQIMCCFGNINATIYIYYKYIFFFKLSSAALLLNKRAARSGNSVHYDSHMGTKVIWEMTWWNILSKKKCDQIIKNV